MIEHDPQVVSQFKNRVLELFGLEQANAMANSNLPSLIDDDDMSEILRCDWNDLPTEVLEALLSKEETAWLLTFVLQHRNYIIQAMKSILPDMPISDAEHAWLQMIAISKGEPSMLQRMPSGREYRFLINDSVALEFLKALCSAKRGVFTPLASLLSGRSNHK